MFQTRFEERKVLETTQAINKSFAINLQQQN